MKNWKKRWFELTASALTYYDGGKGGKIKGVIGTAGITEVRHTTEAEMGS